MGPLQPRTGELGRALGQERRDAFLEVVRLHEAGLRPGLQLELLVERVRLGGVEQPLRLPDRSRGHRCEQLGDLESARGQLLRRHHLRKEPPGPRLLRIEAATGGEPLEGAGRAEQPAREPGAAGVGNEPDRDERGHETRRVGRDSHIARERERKAGTGRGAVHRRDDGLLEGADREDVPVVVTAQVFRDVPRTVRELLEVLADAETPAGSGDHDRANARILRSLHEAGVDPLVHRAVERVQDLRPVERDRQDAVGACELDLRHG